MKFGRSILLSELIEAARIEYADCRAFQIVCPICREPVFKAVREHEANADQTRHYLSHYKAASAYSAECELRVGQFDAAQVEKENRPSRGQKLELFLRLLRDAVIRYEYKSPEPKVKTLFCVIERSKPLRELREWSVRTTEQEEFGAPYFETAAQGFIEDVGAEHTMWKTGLGVETRQRIALEIWLALRTPAWRENMQFLWVHGYASLLGRLGAAQAAGTLNESDKRLRYYAESLIFIGARRGAELLEEMNRISTTEQADVLGATYLSRLVADVQHEMSGCLLRLPYLQILADNMDST